MNIKKKSLCLVLIVSLLFSCMALSACEKPKKHILSGEYYGAKDDETMRLYADGTVDFISNKNGAWFSGTYEWDENHEYYVMFISGGFYDMDFSMTFTEIENSKDLELTFQGTPEIFEFVGELN